MQHSIVYPVLLTLADFCDVPGVRENAVQLLNLLPTQSRVLENLRAALQSSQPAQDFQQLLSVHQTAAQFGMPPARLLYFLQASHNTAKALYCYFVTS